MKAIMEPIFEIPYLVGVVILGIKILCLSGDRNQFKIFGIMAIVLGCGDAFHLVPRIYALWTDGIANHPGPLGFGKLVTSITMTVFYVLLYHVWQVRYKKEGGKIITITVYILAALRIMLCLLPQNQWMEADAPLRWGIYRNLPFVALGMLIIALYAARSNKDPGFRWMWLAIILSFTFYIPVVLWADSIPMLGMLMIPKTCAYVWIVWMGYREAVR